ncbi:MAG TPA: FAD-binding oxidoreductase [Usitatibacter sp.]|nr:FAD-binding oxidoreductase [Usitatibacter sp.]
MPDDAPRTADQQHSLWMATAAPAPECAPLEGGASADVAIVGAGFTGLSCAIALAAHDRAVTVIEAGEIGHGGSGRNGGQVIPGLKQDPDEIAATFDKDVAQRLTALSGSAADRVFALIERHGIECNAEHRGWLQPAHNATALEVVRKRAAAWRAHGAPVEMLDARQARDALGSDYYCGGWIDRRGGAVQPLSYARGLARAAMGLGAAVYCNSPAIGLARDGERWTIATPRGTVSARHVVLATDAYSGELQPEVQRNFVSVNSVQIATDVLPTALRSRIIPAGLPVSDTHRLLYYFRLDPQGRFVIGGRGNVSGDISEGVFAFLRGAAEKLYPDLRGIDWPYRWWGQVGLTRDWMPHLAELAPGMWTSVGYCGRGVAMATAMGQVLANRILEGALARSDPALEFPVKPLTRVPLWKWRKPLVAAAIGWFRTREALGIPA